MDPARQSKFKPVLENLAKELRESLSTAASDAAPVSLDSSIGRLSRMDAIQSQQMALELKRRQENQLLRVERALKAIDQGAYGTCAKCGGDIAEERLEIQPDAVMCVGCAGGGGR